MPILENALASLDTITQNDITNIKSMQKPPENVKLVLAAICVMMGEKPERITDPNDSTKKIMDFWGPSKKLLGDNILVKLKTYDLDNIDPKRIAELRKVYIVHENMRENHIFLRLGYTYTQYDNFSFIHPLYISVRSHARDCSVYHGLKYPYFQVLHQ